VLNLPPETTYEQEQMGTRSPEPSEFCAQRGELFYWDDTAIEKGKGEQPGTAADDANFDEGVEELVSLLGTPAVSPSPSPQAEILSALKNLQDIVSSVSLDPLTPRPPKYLHHFSVHILIH
jgi:hypothetical protein